MGRTVVSLVTGSVVSALAAAQGNQVQDGSMAEAEARWRAGDVAQAHELASGGALSGETGASEAEYLLVKTSFVQGRFEASLAHYAKVGADEDGLAELDELVVEANLRIGRAEDALAFAMAGAWRARRSRGWRRGSHTRSSSRSKE